MKNPLVNISITLIGFSCWVVWNVFSFDYARFFYNFFNPSGKVFQVLWKLFQGVSVLFGLLLLWQILASIFLIRAMKDIKRHIEYLYIGATLNDESPASFASKIMELIGEDEKRQTRSQSQSRARWKYLTMVANVLNDRGDTFDAHGIDIPIRYNKDILYQVYWNPMRHTLYPEKKRQLDSKEFSNVVDHVMSLFAMVFDINIPFPDIRGYLQEQEYNDNK